MCCRLCALRAQCTATRRLRTQLQRKSATCTCSTSPLSHAHGVSNLLRRLDTNNRVMHHGLGVATIWTVSQRRMRPGVTAVSKDEKQDSQPEHSQHVGRESLPVIGFTVARGDATVLPHCRCAPLPVERSRSRETPESVAARSSPATVMLVLLRMHARPRPQQRPRAQRWALKCRPQLQRGSS